METKTKPEVQVDIRPTGMESAVVYAPFDVALDSLTEQGYDVISLPQNSQLRMQRGADAPISRNGNWTREGILYVPNGKPRLVRNSPVLLSAREATECHRNGKEFYPTKEQIEQALLDSADFPTENIEIPTDRFGSDALAVFAFGGEAEARAYGEFLRNARIKKMPVCAVDKDYVTKQNQPFARQMWFRSLDGGSELDGDDRDLDDVNRLRGVKMSAEGTRQNSVGSYDSKTIAKALKELGLSGLEKGLLEKLKQ